MMDKPWARVVEDDILPKIDVANIDTLSGTSTQSKIADDYLVELTKIEGLTNVAKCTLTFTATTITASNNTALFTSSFAVGNTITISGCSTSANNTTAVITAITGTVITCSASAFTSAVETVDVTITNGTNTYSTAISPTNPATITSVGDSAYDVVATGKNLLSISNGTYTSSGITAVVSNGSISISGTATADGFIIIPCNFLINGTYTLSVNNAGVSTNSLDNIRLEDSSSRIVSTIAQLNVVNSKATFTQVNTKATKLVIRMYTGSTINTTLTPQLEVGSVTTPYETYRGNQINISSSYPLRSLPNGVRDYFVSYNGDILKYIKKTEKAIFNGGENWTLEATNTNTILFSTSSFITNTSNRNAGASMVCDKLIVKTEDMYSLDTEGIGYTNGGNFIRLRIAKTRLSTSDLAGFKTWLVSNPITVIYQLTTPVETVTTTPSTLTSYKGITNVFTTANPQPLLTTTFKSRLKNVNDIVNGMPATNLISNSDFMRGMEGWTAVNVGNYTVNSNEMMFTANAQYSHLKTNISLVPNHKYYMSAYVQATSNLVAFGIDQNTSINLVRLYHSGSGNYERISTIITAPSSDINNSTVYIQDRRSSSFNTIKFKYPMVIDITETFGGGYEPSSAIEVETILSSKFQNGYLSGTVNPLMTHKEMFAYFNENKANIKQEDWITPTLLNGATGTIKYRKDQFNNLEFKGDITSTSSTSHFMVLPTGYKPSENRGVSVVNNVYVVGSLMIYSSGYCYITNSAHNGTAVYLNNISIPLD